MNYYSLPSAFVVICSCLSIFKLNVLFIRPCSSKHVEACRSMFIMSDIFQNTSSSLNFLFYSVYPSVRHKHTTRLKFMEKKITLLTLSTNQLNSVFLGKLFSPTFARGFYNSGKSCRDGKKGLMHGWDGGIPHKKLLCYENYCDLGDSNGIKKNKEVERWQMEWEEKQSGSAVILLRKFGVWREPDEARLGPAGRIREIKVARSLVSHRFLCHRGGNSFTHMLNSGTTGNGWKNRQRMESKRLSAGAESTGTLSGPVVGAQQMRHNRVKTLSSALYWSF